MGGNVWKLFFLQIPHHSYILVGYKGFKLIIKEEYLFYDISLIMLHTLIEMSLIVFSMWYIFQLENRQLNNENENNNINKFLFGIHIVYGLGFHR